MAKNEAIKKAKQEGMTGFGVAPEGIFSVVTYATYRQVAFEYSTWCKGKARTMEEAEKYVPQYLRERIYKGLSPWTLQRDRSALRKIFRNRTLGNEVKLPKRSYKTISRSRHEVAMDKKFAEGKHRDTVDFCRAAGLRRHELIKVKPSDVSLNGNSIIVWQGKGGKTRQVTVVSSMVERLKEILVNKDPQQELFPKIPAKMDVHSYRREYAQARLEEADPMTVSGDLGHNRLDVMKYHYMDPTKFIRRS